MANKQNLTKMGKNRKLTTEEAQRIGSIGGKKSVEVKREKKMLKELLEEALETKTKTGNRYVDITRALIEEAEKGNTKAYEIIRDTLGQKPKENVNISAEVNNPFSELSTEELRQLIKNDK